MRRAFVLSFLRERAAQSKTHMNIEVLLFAGLKEAAGAERVAVQIEDGASVGALLQACGEQHPTLAKWLPYVRVAVNCTYAAHERHVQDGDEIAFLPPVSGGEVGTVS